MRCVAAPLLRIQRALAAVEKERVGTHKVVPMAALSGNGWCSE
jgi:hypothetical protein